MRKYLEGTWQVVDDVAGHEALLSQVAGGQVAGQPVQVDAQQAGLLLVIATGEQAEEYAGEHVAAAGGGHAGVAGGVEGDVAVGHADGCVIAF